MVSLLILIILQIISSENLMNIILEIIINIEEALDEIKKKQNNQKEQSTEEKNPEDCYQEEEEKTPIVLEFERIRKLKGRKWNFWTKRYYLQEKKSPKKVEAEKIFPSMISTKNVQELKMIDRIKKGFNWWIKNHFPIVQAYVKKDYDFFKLWQKHLKKEGFVGPFLESNSLRNKMNSMNKLYYNRDSIKNYYEKLWEQVDSLKNNKIIPEMRKSQGEKKLTKLKASEERKKLVKRLIKPENLGMILSPWKLLPNTGGMNILTQPWDEDFLKSGKRKRKGKALIWLKKGPNCKNNNYITKTLIELNRLRAHWSKFWELANILASKSKVWQTLGFNKTFPDWHRENNISSIPNIVKKMYEIKNTKYKYYELEIVSNGKRTLGVPAKEWRWYLWMLEHIILIFLSPYISINQMGFFPTRGTKTAWIEVFRQIITKKNILEFDLKKFFPSINLDYLHDMLLACGVPHSITQQVISWNRTAPTNGENTSLNRKWESEKEEALYYKYHKIRVWGLTGNQDFKYWLKEKRKEESKNPEITRFSYYLFSHNRI